MLRQLDQQHDHVGDTFTGDGGRRNKRDVSSKVLVFIVQDGVETLLGKRKLGGFKTVVEFSLSVGVLLGKCLPETSVGDVLPSVTPIDLVEGDDEGSLSLSQESDRFERLRLQSVL